MKHVETLPQGISARRHRVFSTSEKDYRDNGGPDSRKGTGDELDEIIKEVESTGHLPLDVEDESFRDSSVSIATSVAQDRRRPGKQKTDQLQTFACMEKHDGTDQDSNPNAETIDILLQMATYYDRIGDNWRTLAYRKGVSALRKQSSLISSKEEALKIAGVGERLAVKIEEIVATKTLRRLESTTTDANDNLLRLFMGIYQVGLSTASRWIAQGYRTLEDLRLRADLTPNQRIGVEHYSDFLQRIPRSEIDQHASIIRQALEVADPGLQAIVGGSYRRGNAECGDIDMIITKKDASLRRISEMILGTVVPRLTKTGYIKVGLATSRSQDHASKWHGASSLPQSGVWRRLDLLFVPWNELGAALLYFTGNDIFNRSMRLLAKRKNMRLNQHGLFVDVMRGEKGTKITEGRLVEGASEERIFDVLGVPWRPPEHRVC